MAQPKTMSEGLAKLRTYLQDCQIAANMLNTIGKTRNVELSTLHVYNVLAGFVHRDLLVGHESAWLNCGTRPRGQAIQGSEY
eukprot:2646920-Amphidinium_carterae.1